MSELSEQLAPYVLRAKAHQSGTKQESRDEVLDKGFSLLRADLAREFHTQIAEVNGVPGCIGLAIDFRPEKRTVEIKGKEPIKFCYFIQVSLAKDETTWRYDGGKSTGELTPITDKLDPVVEKTLFALFGVEA
jgi:hypothetical protein